MDVRLLDTLCMMQRYLLINGVRQPLVVHSGYRSAKTNSNTEGAARNSMHLHG
jgi:uncharacterized protein YcbK (DUF882 family)